MSLFTHIARRLLLVIPMLIGVTLDQPDIVQAAVEKWGLDKPLPEQYLYYLRNLTRGDLGISFKTKRPVAQDLRQYLPATAELGFASLLFALAFGLPLGILAAIKAGSWADHGARVFSLLGASMPPFWSGLMALFLFYYRLQLLPGPGRIDTRMAAPPPVTGMYLVDSLLAGDRASFISSLQHLVLPSIILGWFTPGGAAHRLHQICACPWVDQPCRAFWPCAQEHPGAGHDHHRSAAGRPDRLCHHHRNRVPVARHGPAVHPGGDLC